MHSSLDTVVHFQVQLWELVLGVSRSLLDITKRRSINDVADNEPLDGLILGDGLSSRNASVFVCLLVGAENDVFLYIPKEEGVWKRITGSGSGEPNEVLESNNKDGRGLSARCTYRTRLVCPRPFLFRPWFLRLTVISQCFNCSVCSSEGSTASVKERKGAGR